MNSMVQGSDRNNTVLYTATTFGGAKFLVIAFWAVFMARLYITITIYIFLSNVDLICSKQALLFKLSPLIHVFSIKMNRKKPAINRPIGNPE